MIVTSKRIEFSPEEVAVLLQPKNWWLYMDDDMGTFHVIDIYESSMDKNQLIIYCEAEEFDDDGNFLTMVQCFFNYKKGKTPIDQFVIYHLL